MPWLTHFVSQDSERNCLSNLSKGYGKNMEPIKSGSSAAKLVLLQKKKNRKAASQK